MRNYFTLILFFISFSSFGQTIPSKPKLIVHVVIEQMNYNYLARFESNFGQKGFTKIINNGAKCTNAQLNYAYPESAPSYATISTGAYPGAHGIIGNTWINRISNSKTYAVKDNTQYCVGCSSSLSYQVSPQQILATTFSDELIKKSNGKSKAYSVALKSHAAILMSGRLSNGAFWLDEKTGNWVTSDFYMDKLPACVVDFNNKRFSDIYLKKTWTPYVNINKYTESLDDDTDFEIGIRNKKTFPYKIKELADSYIPYSILTQTPYGNTFTKDLAIEIIDNEQLGKDEYTDYISIAFTVPEEIGNNFGSLSKETQDCFTRLDFELGFLIDYLESAIGKENFVLIVQSAHGVETPIKYEYEQKLPQGIFKHVEAMYILDKYLDATYGDADWIQYYFSQQVYLNHSVIDEKNLSRELIQNISAVFLMQLSGVRSVLTANALNNTAFTTTEKQMVDNSYNQVRSGDLHIILLPGWSQQSMNEVGQHNSSYSSVTHIPLMWYGWNIQQATINETVYVTDIIPTLCEMCGIPRPNMSYGRVIDNIIHIK